MVKNKIKNVDTQLMFDFETSRLGSVGTQDYSFPFPSIIARSALEVCGRSVVFRLRKPPLIRKPPPYSGEIWNRGAFLFEKSAEGGKFWGFESGNDDFLKENRVGRVRKGKIFPPAAGQNCERAKNNV